jgi:hypothetical protein
MPTGILTRRLFLHILALWGVLTTCHFSLTFLTLLLSVGLGGMDVDHELSPMMRTVTDAMFEIALLMMQPAETIARVFPPPRDAGPWRFYYLLVINSGMWGVIFTLAVLSTQRLWVWLRHRCLVRVSTRWD